MSNWAENPLHYRDSLMAQALPKIAYQDCYLYCVDDHHTVTHLSEEQTACFTNCR